MATQTAVEHSQNVVNYTGRILSINWTSPPGSEEQTTMLRVTGIHNPPFFTVGASGDITGYLCDIWKLVASRLGLRYELSAYNSDDYGTRLDNGTWTGMIGLAADNKADVLLSWYMHAPYRGDVLEFLDAVPVEQTAYAFYLAEEESAQVSWEVTSFGDLLKPLHTTSWLVLLALLLLTAIILRVAVRYNHPAAESPSVVRLFTGAHCHLVTFMALVGQGWCLVPTSLAGRTVTITARLLGMLVTFLYTANLISVLTLRPHPKPLESLEDFASRRDWKFSTWKEAPVFNIWRDSADPSERHLYHMREAGHHFLDIDGSEESHRQCLRPNVLCYYDLRQYFIATGEDACVLQSLGHQSRPAVTNNYIVLRKGLGTLRQRANAALLRLRETGVLTRLHNAWFAAGEIQCPGHWTEGHPLSVGDTQAVLMVAPLGCILGLLLLAAEKAVYAAARRRYGGFKSLLAPRWKTKPSPRDNGHSPVKGGGMKPSGVKIFIQYDSASRPVEFKM